MTINRMKSDNASTGNARSGKVYDVTKTRHDPRRHNGHRTFTHTIPFAVGIGFLTTWGCTAGGKWAPAPEGLPSAR